MCSPHLVWQWAQEIQAVTRQLNVQVQRFILKCTEEIERPDNMDRGLRLRQVWQHLMIRRSLSSSIPFKNGKRIGDDIPPSGTPSASSCRTPTRPWPPPGGTSERANEPLWWNDKGRGACV